MRRILIFIFIFAVEGQSEGSKQPPKRGGSSPDLASASRKSSDDLILEKLTESENLILKSIGELKESLKKIEVSLTENHEELVLNRRNTEIILSKYYHASCKALKPPVDQLLMVPPAASPISPSATRKISNVNLSQSSIITILLPKVSKLAKVRCETNVAGDGWMVILSRSSGEVLFNKTYAEYEKGFGDPSTEYYLGNEALHSLTSSKPFELRIEVEDFQGKEAWASYKSFKVGSGSSFYPLSIDGFDPKSTTGKDDGFKAHNGMKFSTYDQDNSGKNCAVSFGGGGGWWYSTCYNVLGTGAYRNKEGNEYGGISYWPWHDIKKSLKKFKLLMRPLQ